MSAKHLIASIATVAFTIATAALTATTAFAETADNATATTANAAVSGAALAGAKVEKTGGLTRAEVIAQTLEARKNGQIPTGETDFDVAQTTKHFAK